MLPVPLRLGALSLLRWMALAVLIGRTWSASGCTTDAGCVSACSLATPTGPCTRVSCNAAYLRCVCGDEAALDVDGGCIDAPPIVVGGCQLGYSADIFAAVHASPELRPADLATSGGRASAALITILRRSVAAGLSRQAYEIVATAVKLTPSGGALPQTSIGNASSTSSSGSIALLLQADVRFDFCIGPPALTLDHLSVSGFDSGFDGEARRYAATHSGTARVTRITLVSSALSTSTTTTIAIRAIDAQQVEDESPVARFWWVCWFLLIPIVGVACVFRMVVYRKHTKTVPYDDSVPESLDGPPQRRPSGPIASDLPRVCATSTFRLEDLPNGETVLGLTIEEGDILEVVNNAGEWLYGRRVSKPEETGYFPESHVCWIGRPIAGAVGDSGMLPESPRHVAPETIGMPSNTSASLRDAGQQRRNVSSIGGMPSPPSIEPPNPSNTAQGQNAETGGLVIGTPVVTPAPTPVIGTPAATPNTTPRLGVSEAEVPPRQLDVRLAGASSDGLLAVETPAAFDSSIRPAPVFQLTSTANAPAAVEPPEVPPDLLQLPGALPLATEQPAVFTSPSFSDLNGV